METSIKKTEYDRIISFFEEFSYVKKHGKANSLQRMQDFIDMFAGQYHGSFNVKNAEFNVFDFFNLNYDEVKNSKMLAWLLDYYGSHYKGNCFLKPFLKRCGIDLAENTLQRYTTKTEFSWEHSRIDIIIYLKSNFLIIIENKINASEGDQQLDREFKDLRSIGKRLRIPENRQHAVFLTKDGNDPLTGDRNNWINLSYFQLYSCFREIALSTNDLKLELFLKDWLESISNF